MLTYIFNKYYFVKVFFYFKVSFFLINLSSFLTFQFFWLLKKKSLDGNQYEFLDQIYGLYKISYNPLYTQLTSYYCITIFIDINMYTYFIYIIYKSDLLNIWNSSKLCTKVEILCTLISYIYIYFKKYFKEILLFIELCFVILILWSYYDFIQEWYFFKKTLPVNINEKLCFMLIFFSKDRLCLELYFPFLIIFSINRCIYIYTKNLDIIKYEYTLILNKPFVKALFKLKHLFFKKFKIQNHDFIKFYFILKPACLSFFKFFFLINNFIKRYTYIIWKPISNLYSYINFYFINKSNKNNNINNF